MENCIELFNNKLNDLSVDDKSKLIIAIENNFSQYVKGSEIIYDYFTKYLSIYNDFFGILKISLKNKKYCDFYKRDIYPDFEALCLFWNIPKETDPNIVIKIILLTNLFKINYGTN